MYLAGRFEEAEQAFKASLMRHPNSVGSLYGLWQTQLKLGQSGEAAYTKALLDKAGGEDEGMSVIKL